MERYPLLIPTLADAERICELIQTAERFDEIPRFFVLDELLESFEETHFKLSEHARLVVVADQIVGWVQVSLHPSGIALERANITGTVHPAHRGTGVGRALMAWATANASQRLMELENDLPKYARTYAPAGATDAGHLFARFEFQPVRWFEDLLMPLSARPPATEPSGTTIVSWPVERTEEIRQVKNNAFRDHWGSTPNDQESWARLTNGIGSRLDLSFVALDTTTNAVIGACLNAYYPNDEALLGRRDGWIASLSTLREHRGRGIASALIAHSLDAFAAAGLSHAAIGVDADNPTGASRLYRGIGFEPYYREVVAELQVA